MEERNQQQRITRHLQNEEVQQRILQDMQRAREEATVTISDAANLFDLTDARLRDWEKNGLLSPQRRVQDTEQDGKGAKRRQYTTTELDKLAIIRELIQQGKFSPGAIPTNIDEIWASIVSEKQQKSLMPEIENRDAKHVHIDQRVECTEKEEFWRYFVSQALRLSLLLICEDVPDTMAGAGIILPLEKSSVVTIVRTPNDLPLASYSLVGWLSQSRSFYTFLESEPSFEHPSDFRIEHFANLAEDVSAKQAPLNNILVIVQRKANKENPLILSKEVVEVVQRLLSFIYEVVDEWKPAYEHGVRNGMYQVTDFTVSTNVSDEVLNGLANIVAQLGGKMDDGKDRWRFSCILTPEDTSLPVSKRTLLVRAQSRRAPHRLAAVSAEAPGLSFRAYQSGQIIYRSVVPGKDFMIAYQDHEEFTRSAIAVPLAGEDGIAIGVLYIASEERKAFLKEDERLLRIVGRMIEELLMVYRLRQLPAERLTELITTPEVVDLSFKEFASESDFVNDLEALLARILESEITPQISRDEVSIIAIDIDNFTAIAAKYGDRVAGNLSMIVGERIQGNPSILAGLERQPLYHVNDDRYYLLLKGVSLGEARNRAEALKKRLKEEYRVDARRIFNKRAVLPGTLLKLPDVTVRLCVHCYTSEKLKELLGRYKADFTTQAINAVSGILLANIDKALNIGQDSGGNVIVSWDDKTWSYIVWPPA